MSKLKLKVRTVVFAVLSLSFAFVVSGCTYQVALAVEEATGVATGE